MSKMLNVLQILNGKLRAAPEKKTSMGRGGETALF